tara:strand:+ start:270 stop:458 length:189 start_codon:yes stop_codon:yes gene_type:complete
MPSLDGHSLSQEIKKLREDVFSELSRSREAFSELYHYMLKFETMLSEKPEKKGAKNAKRPKN